MKDETIKTTMCGVWTEKSPLPPPLLDRTVCTLDRYFYFVVKRIHVCVGPRYFLILDLASTLLWYGEFERALNCNQNWLKDVFEMGWQSRKILVLFLPFKRKIYLAAWHWHNISSPVVAQVK